MDRDTSIWRGLTIAAVGLLTIFLGFRNGGFFAGETAVATIVVGLLAVGWYVAAPDPLGGLTLTGAVAAVALGVLAVFDLRSGGRSGSQARAILEFDRTLLYALTFTLFASIRGGSRTLRGLAPVVGLAFALLAAAGVLGRTAPGIVDVAAARDGVRLDWPFGYWNGLGIASAAGLLLCLGAAADRGHALVLRAACAAATPSLAVALYLTLSRGATLAALLGGAVLLVGRGRFALLPALAGFVAAAGALVVAYGQAGLLEVDATAAELAAAGQPVVLATGVATVAALVLAALAARLTRGIEPRPALRPRTQIAVVAGAVVLLGAGVAAAGAADDVEDAWRDVTARGLAATDDPRDRLTTAGSNGRIDHWEVAVQAFRRHPVAGSGAGSYDIDWLRERRVAFSVQDAHSLYLEAAAERGALGLALLLLALGTGTIGLLRRGRDFATVAAIAAVAAWLLHSGIDWNWELPGVSLWVFAALGAACARNDDAPGRSGFGSPLRLVAGLALLSLLLVPVAIARSQRALGAALVAFEAGDCSAVIDRSLEAIERARWRPEGFELLAYCDVRLGRADLARSAMASAVARDSRDWELTYGEALVTGATGGDPLPGLRRALLANPLEKRARSAVDRMLDLPALRDRQQLARELPLPVPARPDP